MGEIRPFGSYPTTRLATRNSEAVLVWFCAEQNGPFAPESVDEKRCVTSVFGAIVSIKMAAIT